MNHFSSYLDFGLGGSNTNSTDYFSLCDTMETLTQDDYWKGLAEKFLLDSNSTSAVVDVFCNAWIEEGSSPTTSSHGFSSILKNPMAQTIGWTVIMMLKTVFLEGQLDHWQGASRTLTIGSTLVPFGMASWGILQAMIEANGDANDNSIREPLSGATIATMIWNSIVHTPLVRSWVLATVGWAIFHNIVMGKLRSSKLLASIEQLPGIVAGLFSIACWILDEQTVAKWMLGNNQTTLSPNALQVYAMLMHNAANIVLAWYSYAYAIRGMLGANRFTSFPCFLVVALAAKVATSGYVL